MFDVFRIPVVGAVVLACTGLGFAEEVVDQQNDPASTSSFSCGTPPILNATILQSFVPTLARLGAVELRLRAGDAFPLAGVTATVRIREATSDGVVLAEANATIGGPQAVNTQILVRFELGDVELTPGETYLIEWLTPDSNVLGWVGSSSDPYADGTAFSCIGNPWPGGATDFNFTTLALVDGPATPKERLAALQERVALEITHRRARCLQRLLDLACRCLDKGRARLAILKLRIFQWKVHAFVCSGRLSADAGDALIDEAREIVSELRATLPVRHHRRSRR